MEFEGPRPAYTMSGEEAVATLDVLHAEIARLQSYSLEVTSRLDETGHTKESTGQDTARFISSRYRRNLHAVRRDLALANALPKYRVVSAALPDPYAPPGGEACIQSAGGPGVDDGEEVLSALLHPDQAEAIVSSLEGIPAAAMVSVENLLAAEEQMVQAARYSTPLDLKKLGLKIRDILDTDGPEPAEEAAERREALRLTDADHGVKFSGFLANASAEMLKALVEAGSKPHLTVDGERDPRTRDKRQADALADILSIAAGAGELPGHGGVKPHITVTMDLTDLKTMGRDATGDLQFGEGLSAAAVRRLACDAGVIPMVLGSESEPLDVGREERYVTRAMRRALNRRDKGCVVCRIPPRYCHAHHIVSWLDGGATCVGNLVLLCSTHHRGIHAGHYTVTITNNKAHVARPTWTEPDRTARVPLGLRPLNPINSPPTNTGPIAPWTTTADGAPDFDPWGSAGLDSG